MGGQGHSDNMHAIRFKWEWSLNSIGIVATFVAELVGWGYMIAEVRGTLDNHTNGIADLRAEVRRVDEANRKLENHEMRIQNVENLAGSAAEAARSLEKAINKLSSDLRLTGEILQRLERQRSSRHPAYEQGAE